jgi:hypothetical protein
MQVDIIKIEKAIYHEEKKDKVLVGMKDPLIMSKIYYEVTGNHQKAILLCRSRRSINEDYYLPCFSISALGVVTSCIFGCHAYIDLIQ